MNDFYDIELIKNVIEYNKQKFDAYIYEQHFEINPEYEKILSARYHKNARIRERLVYLCSRCKYIWFCTFTFKNEYINKCMRTKRDLVKKVLKQYDFKYILNVDYGTQTEREHYHCIIGTDYDLDLHELFSTTYIGGFSKSIQCKNGREDIKRLSKYINKLVNHCIKASTNRQRIVYNFKGYDLLYTHSADKRVAYLIDYYRLCDV